MVEQKKPLNFATDDFSDKDFLDFIKEPIQEKIQYFSVLMSKKDNEEEPLIFWLNTGEKVWYRFFIEAPSTKVFSSASCRRRDADENIKYSSRDLSKNP